MKNLKFALKQIIPLTASYIILGMAIGMLFNESGYSLLYTFLSSAFIYAGSMQIVLISLMKAGTNIFIIALMTFFINGRHIFYGISFIDEFKNIGNEKGSFWKYPYMALTVTDETYSVLCSMECPKYLDEKKVKFYVLAICHLLWIVSNILGALVGKFLPFNTAGIEFSAVAFFVTVVVDQWIKFDSHIPAICGFVSSVIFYLTLGPNNFILPALSLSMVVLMIMKNKIMLNDGSENL